MASPSHQQNGDGREAWGRRRLSAVVHVLKHFSCARKKTEKSGVGAQTVPGDGIVTGGPDSGATGPWAPGASICSVLATVAVI